MVDAVSIENPQDVPEQWRPYFEKRDIEFTFRALERKVQSVAPGTIIRALTGQGKPTGRTVDAISEALGITSEKFYELRGEPVAEPFILSGRASQLTTTERAVVRSVVDAILNAKGARHAVPVDSSTSSGASTEGGPPQEVPRSGDGPKPWTPPPDWIWPTDDDPGVGDSEDAQDA